MTIQLTEEQLNDIVKKAIEKSVKSAVAEVLQEKGFQEALNVMAANRGKGDIPKVGIFWYNVSQQCLFGVVSNKRIDYDKPNAGGEIITCSDMHEAVWKKEYYKQRFHRGGNGPFKGEYQNKPQERVFYSPTDDGCVYHCSWRMD